jgi:hypothetical protein
VIYASAAPTMMPCTTRETDSIARIFAIHLLYDSLEIVPGVEQSVLWAASSWLDSTLEQQRLTAVWATQL